MYIIEIHMIIEIEQNKYKDFGTEKVMNNCENLDICRADLSKTFL